MRVVTRLGGWGLAGVPWGRVHVPTLLYGRRVLHRSQRSRCCLKPEAYYLALPYTLASRDAPPQRLEAAVLPKRQRELGPETRTLSEALELGGQRAPV